MNNQLKLIFGAALLTTAGIILFQLHWLHKTYHDQRMNFKLAASDALQRAVDLLIADDIKRNMEQDTYKLSMITMIEGTADSGQVIALNEAMKTKLTTTMQSLQRQDSNTTVHIRMMEEIDQRSNFLQAFRSRILAEGLKENIKITDLSRIYRQELKKKDIDETFQLAFKGANSLPKASIEAYTSLSAESRVVTAIFPALDTHLLSVIINPILISGLLLVLSLGSMWYMWHIILRQKQLDTMKNDFIDNITHELKTPVTIMSATNESLLAFGGIDDKERISRYLKHNKNELKKLSSMIENILTLAQYEKRTSRLATEYINLTALAESIVNRYYKIEGVYITLQHAPDDIWINSNKDGLEVIMTNLIDNAVKYNNETKKQIVLTVLSNENSYSIKVSDNGIGIADRYHPYIFDKFYRVSQENIHDVKGFGMGLSYVKALVNQLNGTITVNSRKGTGTTFTIQIPYYEKD